jgi:cobalt-zinc-cadmium efflux system protein
VAAFSVSRSGRLTVVLVLNVALVAGLVAVSLGAHSLGVLAEGADYLADAAAIGVSLFAIWLSRRPPTPDRPNGYPKATAVAALVNGGWLLILSLLVIASGIDRLATGVHAVHGLPVVVVSGVAAVVMLAGALVLGGDVDDLRDDDLNMRAVLLDTAADAATAAGVAIAGGIILSTGGLYWLDPSVAVVISAVVGCQAAQLLRRVASTLRIPKSMVRRGHDDRATPRKQHPQRPDS